MLQSFFRREPGRSLAEWALILALIIIVIVGAWFKIATIRMAWK